MYIVYNIATTIQKNQSYKTASAAKAAVTRLNKQENAVVYAYANKEDYNTKVVKMVERVNMMSGKTYMEPSNTPRYCSPSSEAYWSM